MAEETKAKENSSKMSENEQVELVFLKFGLAESDHELEMSVDRFLPAILAKVASPDEKIRTKVMQLLTHISNRLKSRTNVRLPVDKLLDMYKSDASSFIVNFAIIYIKLGYSRLSVPEQSALAPKLFAALEGKPKTHQDTLLRVLVSTFPHIKLPESPEKRKSLFDFEKYPTMTKRLLEFCLDVLLMPYSASMTSVQAVRPSTAPAGERAGLQGPVPPGLSLNGVKRLIGDSPETSWSLAQIEQIKVGILELFGGDIFEENDITAHLVIASSDTRHTVSNNADMELKKRQGSMDWNNAYLIGMLYRLYLGDAQVRSGGKKNQKPNLALQRKPVQLRTKLKIVQYLMRSRAAAEKFPLTIQLIYGALFSEDTSSRLNILGLEFVHHICDSCELAKLLPQSPLILDAMLKTTQGFEGEHRTRGLAYTAMGKLSRRVPNLFSSNLKLVQDAFQDLSQENSQELKLYIQEALAMMSKAYSSVPNEHLPLVEAIIAKYISDPDHLCRLSAVRYAGVVFSTDHVSSRYLLLLAASDVKEDVASEAKKLLYGGEITLSMDAKPETESKSLKLPPFSSVLNYIHEKAEERLKSSKRFLIGTQAIAFPPSTFLVLLQYLRKCLLEESIQSSKFPRPFSDDRFSEAQFIADHIQQMWQASEEAIIDLIAKYVNLVLQFLKPHTDTDATYILLEIFATCPDEFPVDILLSGHKPFEDPLKESERKNLVKTRIEWVKSLTHHTREAIREYGSELYSLILKRLPESENGHIHVISELLSAAQSDKNYEKKHGSILTLGHMLGDVLANTDSNQEMTPQEIKDALICLVQHATTRDATIATASCSALGEVMRKSALPLPNGEPPKQEDKEKSASVIGKDLTKCEIVEVLLGHLKSSTAHKLREKSVIALGCLPVGDGGFPFTEYLLNRILDSSEIKEIDLHFTVATALCNVALGAKSSAKQSKWRRKKMINSQGTESSGEVAWLLKKILSEYISHRIPAARQAACVWLLTILKTDEVANHPEIRKVLPDIQSAFMSLLSEADDLVQDVASKGLGVVYELGTEEQKKQLVDGLVVSLTGGTAHTTKANQDNLFQDSKGIGKAPDGSKLTTYKEICSLASDLNQPDLVYKFLHLAKHQALWNSKKGAAFGFSNIASLASEQLAPHLPKIVPRLYRYTFDPQPGVRSAMTSIWNALAPDPKKLVKISFLFHLKIAYFTQVGQGSYLKLIKLEYLKQNDPPCNKLGYLIVDLY